MLSNLQIDSIDSSSIIVNGLYYVYTVSWSKRQTRGVNCQGSVSRYFARQLLNKHAKNYQNAEKITKFLLSTKMVWKSIKHISKTLSITEAMFSQFFFLTCTVDWICAKCKYSVAMIEPGPRNQHRVNGDQQDSVDSAGQLWPAACNLDVKLCRRGPVTVLT
jgi:hypothetical protein